MNQIKIEINPLEELLEIYLTFEIVKNFLI